MQSSAELYRQQQQQHGGGGDDDDLQLRREHSHQHHHMSSSGSVPALRMSQWAPDLASSPMLPGLADSRASVPAPLLLSRSIRDPTHRRASECLSREVSNRTVQSGDDNDDSRHLGEDVVPRELSPRLVRTTTSMHTSKASPNGSSTSWPTSTTAAAAAASGEMPTNFEALWSNIDRYLFAVYTTLQTGDESSLRPLRAPRHRMGWYTVIYNACSGDPAKSRELYARLALLLLHILESHVLFPILQNVDHNRVQFLTGTEDDAPVRSSSSVATEALGRAAAGGTPGTGAGSGSSSSGWGRFKSLATGTAAATPTGAAPPAAASAPAGRSSKDPSRSSSVRSPRGGANSSFAFMKRIFHPSTTTSSHPPPAARSANHSLAGADGVRDGRRQPQSPGAPTTPSSARDDTAPPDAGAGAGAGGGRSISRTASWLGRQNSSTRWAASSTSGPSTPMHQPIAFASSNSFGPRGNGTTGTPRSSSPASTTGGGDLHSAFLGFDSAVHRSPEDSAHYWQTRTPTPSLTPPPPPPPLSSMPQPQHAAVRGGRGLMISVAPSSHASPGTPLSPAQQRPQSPGTSNSGLSRHSTQVIGAAQVAASGLSSSSTATQSPTSVPRAVSVTAPPSAIAVARHARVASKTGRVLVDDEEEVLCEANTVAPASHDARDKPRRRTGADGRRHSRSGSDTSSLIAFASFNDTEEGTAGQHPRDAGSDVGGRGSGSNSSLHTMQSSLSDAANHGGTVAARSSPTHTRRVSHADDDGGGGTLEPSANYLSPITATLSPGDDDAISPFLSSEPSITMRQAAPDAVTSSSTATTAPPPPAAASRSTVLEGSALRTPEELSVAHTRAASGDGCDRFHAPPSEPCAAAGAGASAAVSVTVSLDTSAAASAPASAARHREAPDPFVDHPSRRAAEATNSPTTPVPGSGGGSAPTDVRRFSLCYTFIQEWHTFLVFRGVVLSCFRYLDQYYTRRFGMDTIALMCFKVFHVVIYEPLQPLLLIELRYLTQYVREVFESTGQVAWEQLEMMQEVYSIITELLLLVQSTSSSMVAQQQQPKTTQGGSSAGTAGGSHTVGCSSSGGGGGATLGGAVATGAAPGAAAASLTSPIVAASVMVLSAPPGAGSYSRPSSRSRSTASARRDSGASSAAGTPQVGALDVHGNAAASPLGVPPTAEADRAGGSFFGAASPSSPHVSKRSRLFSLFTGNRQADSGRGSRKGSQAAVTPGSAPVSPWTAPQPAGGAGRASVFDVDGGGGEAAGRGVRRAETPGPVDTPLSVAAGFTTAVVVNLRGMVELRDRLEGHTSGHHLTTQALKQWEGMAADRRLRVGTIIKEMAAPLLTTVMEDVGNDYIAGIYAFYRYACAAHRSTEAERSGYVTWAGAVKELEGHVWRRVRLPFLHAALRSALNDVLVVEPHRRILLDHQFGLRALLDAWGASAVAAELTLVPQTPSSAAAAAGAPSSAPRGSPWKDGPFSTGGRAGGGGGGGGGGLSMAPSGTTDGLSRGPSKYIESPITISLHGSHQHHLSPFPHQRTSSALSSEVSGSLVATPPRSASVAAADNLGRNSTASDRLLARAGVGASAVRGDATPAVGAARPVIAAFAAGVAGGTEGGELEATLRAMESLFGLFSDVTSDECFVLMAVILVKKLIHDAAHLFEQYLKSVIRPPPAAASAASAAPPGQAVPGVALVSGLVALFERYADLVERVFRNHATLRRAAADAVEEIMRPARWTRNAALHASQQRAHEALMSAGLGAMGSGARMEAGAAAAAAAAAAASSSSLGTGLPSVLLSRDARQATLPLMALGAEFPDAVAQLRLSVLLARYADAFLQQQARGGGRVLSADLVKRLHLVARLVSRLDDKDTFLEHYRLCLARRLLGFSSPAAGSAGAGVESTSTSLNIDAERQLVSLLQAYVGVAGTHAFEAMLRDYEGTERTRELFEEEPAYRALPAKIRVQLITSAQWPTYTMLPLQPHASLQRGTEVFRAHYAKLHPSRTLLWVFSIGTATLNAEFAGGAKQVVASTLLATLLLEVSDAYNSADGGGVITGAELARRTGLPFHALRNHLHLLTQHRAFSLLRWAPACGSGNASLRNSSTIDAAAAASGGAAPAALQEVDSFTLNPTFTHRLRKIRLPLPKARPTGLPLTGDGAAAAVDSGLEGYGELPTPAAASPSGAGVGDEDALVTRHVSATRRVLLDAAIVRIFKSRRVVAFEDLLQTVTAQLARQFLPSRRDVKAQLEGLIDRDYVRRSPDDPNTFVYVS